MVKKSKTSTNQMFMAFIFVGILVLGFVGVAYVESEYQNNRENVVLFKSDSNTKFARYETIGLTYEWFDYYGNVQNEKKGNTYFVYNRTAVYSGNNTWSYYANATSSTTYNAAVYLIDIPNLDNWLISSIKYSVSLPGNSELSFNSAMVYPINGIRDVNRLEPTTTSLISNADVGGKHIHNYTLNVSTTKSMQIFQNCNEIENADSHLFIGVSSTNPFTAWSYSISIEIMGEKIGTSNLHNSLSMVIGLSVIINIATIFYLTDKIDIGGYVKHIKKRR